MADTPKILVVDDDPIILDSLCEYLRVEGYESVGAADGAAALGAGDSDEGALSPATSGSSQFASSRVAERPPESSPDVSGPECGW